jgi:hypothetical protein
MSNPGSLLIFSPTSVVSIVALPQFSSNIDVVPSIVYSGGRITVFGQNFVPLYQNCSARVGGTNASCFVLSDTALAVVVPTSLPVSSYVISVNFSNPASASVSTSKAFLQVWPSPLIASSSPFYPPVAYSGSSITVTGEYFLSPDLQSCSVTVCALRSFSCNVLSPTRLTFVVGLIGAARNCTVVIAWSNPSSLAVSSASGYLQILEDPIVSMVPSISYAGSTVTVRGLNFIPGHQNCIPYVCGQTGESCLVASNDSVTFRLDKLFAPGSCIVEIVFSNPKINKTSAKENKLQVLIWPSVDSSRPFEPLRAYPGSKVTMNGVSFVPSSQTCNALVCGVAAASCKVLSTVAIEFVVSSASPQGSCPVSVQFDNPSFTIQTSLNVASFPTVNVTALPSRTYFGSSLKVYFNELFTEPFLCLADTICLAPDIFSETSAIFKMPPSDNSSLTSRITFRIKNPDLLIGSVSLTALKGPQIFRIDSSPPQPQSTFMIYGRDFLPPCRIKPADGTTELASNTVVNSTSLLATWLDSAIALWSQQSTISALIACYACNASDLWCVPEGPPAISFFSMELNDAGVSVSGSASTLQLQPVSNARPFSISIGLSSPVDVVAGDEGVYVAQLLDSANRSVSDVAALSTTAVFVQKSGMNATEFGLAVQEGLSFVYKLKHFKAEIVTLHFQGLGLGGILATYYRDDMQSQPFLSGIQESLWLRASSHVVLHTNSFHWAWYIKASVSGG